MGAVLFFFVFLLRTLKFSVLSGFCVRLDVLKEKTKAVFPVESISVAFL